MLIESLGKDIKKLKDVNFCVFFILYSLILLERIFVLVWKFTLDYIVKGHSPTEIMIFYFQEKSNKPWEQSALQNPRWWSSPGSQGQSFPEHNNSSAPRCVVRGWGLRGGEAALMCH